MHAVVVTVTVNDAEASLNRLRDEVVPQVKQSPGVVAGYWTRKDDTGISMVVFESEDDAKAMSERVPTIVPDEVTLESVEVREVVAHT
jgi:hypothetical protein